jgi:hypothetical protein
MQGAPQPSFTITAGPVNAQNYIGANTVNPSRRILSGIPSSSGAPPSPLIPAGRPLHHQPYNMPDEPLKTPQLTSLHQNNCSGGSISMASSSIFLASEVVNGNKYQCPTCGDRFNRLSRAESCYNSHSGSKPFVCGGQCGDETW